MITNYFKNCNKINATIKACDFVERQENSEFNDATICGLNFK